MHDAYGILLIESSDWDAEQIRAAMNRHIAPAKFAVVKAGDFAAAGPADAAKK